VEAARRVRALLGAYESKRDLLAIGAYQKGSDAELDEALARMPQLEALLRQDPRARSSFDEAVTQLRKAVAKR
jgi:flagellum-specific ATP synthase